MASWLGEPLVGQYKGLDLTKLPLNHAYVLANTSLRNAGVYTVADDCYDCPFKLFDALHPDKDMSWQIDTSVQQTWRIMKNNQQQYLARNYRRGLICEMRPGLGEFAVYQLDIGRCSLDEEVAPVNSYLPLMFCGLIFLGMLLIYMSAKSISSCRQRVIEIRNGKPLQAKDKEVHKHNMRTLNVLRGFLILFVIFITNGGGGYPLFNNIRGELSIADWSFYFYTWTVGFCIPTKLSEEKCKGLSKKQMFLDIIKRTLVLIFVGTAIDSIAFIPGLASESQIIWWPLQRLGAAYFTGATLCLLTASEFEFQSKKLIPKMLSNTLTLKWCLVFAGFTLAMIAILIPTALSINCQSNTNLIEHLAEFSDNITEVTQICNNTATEVFNQVFVGRSQGLFSISGYYGFGAGLMGILTTTALTITGLMAGTIYLNEESHKTRLQLWIFWATVFAVCGVAVAGISFPIRLNLWPIAFIFVSSSLSSFILSVIYTLTEKEQSKCPMLAAVGVTSLEILASHFLISSLIPFYWNKNFSNHLFYLLQNIGFVVFWIIIAIILTRKNFRFTV